MQAREWETPSFRPSRASARPFLKWAGGKRALLPTLTRLLGLPDPGRAYFEPFLGSGATFFGILPDHAVLSDVNWPLVQTFKAVKSRTSTLISHLEALPRNPTRDQYYIARKRFNDLLEEGEPSSEDASIEIAALVVWLNHTCFNGLYRVNASGKFNVPFGGRGERFIFSAAALKAASSALRQSRAELYCASYEKVITRAGRGDVLYLDPPYEPVDKQGNFTGYSAGGFTTEAQLQLSEHVHNAVNRGCRVVLCNSSAPIIRELYRGYDQHEVMVNRAINCEGTLRGPVTELIIVSRS